MKSRVMRCSVAWISADGDWVDTLRHGNGTGDAGACVQEMTMSGATELNRAGIGAPRSSVLRTAIAANIGAVFEWYDLLLYALFAVTLSKQFFPPGNPNSAVLLSLGTFAVAWLVRPIGAVVIGTY